MYIERALEPLVRRYSENFKIVAVTGPRQVGKTTMLKHLMEEEAESGVDRVYVTLDNTAILQTAKEDPALFLQRYRPPVLIDEIQKAPELLPYIKMIVDERDELTPLDRKLLLRSSAKRRIQFDDIQAAAMFCVYGQLGILLADDLTQEDKSKRIREFLIFALHL